MTSKTNSLLPLLKQYFGYTSFRPLQEEIMRDSLSGRDVFALLPTGGGKSLCYQLPALVRPGLTLVVSPLIALMKDQVQAMETYGIPATFLNSSLDGKESHTRLRDLHRGRYRLLYAAPERLMLSHFLSDLQRWKVACLAIDEAHCISEWGHDFRPEYRKLAELRDHFPEVPILALTATATSRVRSDIIRHLRLKEPKIYAASFNRPNLAYQVFSKDNPDDQVLRFLKQHEGESGIIYCQSRRATEEVAEALRAHAVKAAPYHAGLSTEERSRNQDLFLRDEVQVICATIAFGMGVNKPNVRFVLHYDLPKNIEGYYQETGRSGRDGLPSECLLLFSVGDAVKQSRFIEEKPDPKEREIAKSQLEQMIHYAESAACRRKTLLSYFGEAYQNAESQCFRHARGGTKPPSSQENCGSCDNCLSPRATYDGTSVSQKFISCVYRIRQKSGFGVGMKHLIEVLTGADTEKIRRWRHHELSTYGIGKEQSRREWAAIGRELLRLGLLHQSSDKFSVLELTEEGRAVLRDRKSIVLTRPMDKPETSAGGARLPDGQGSAFGGETTRTFENGYDEVLFEHLRQLRRRLADERDIPTYIVFSDAALRQMARDYPAEGVAFGRISGVGEKKLKEFGPIFLKEIADYLKKNPRRNFATVSSMIPEYIPKRRHLNDTGRETLRRFCGGESVEQIACERRLVSGTIYSHLAEAIEAGETVDLNRLFKPEEQKEIEEAFSKLGFGNLTGVREWLNEKFDYGMLRIYRSICQRRQKTAGLSQ